MERVIPFKLVQRKYMKDHMDCEAASLESKNCWSMLDLHPAVCVRSKKTIMDVEVKNTYFAQLIRYNVMQTNNSFKAPSSIACSLSNPVILSLGRNVTHI